MLSCGQQSMTPSTEQSKSSDTTKTMETESSPVPSKHVTPLMRNPEKHGGTVLKNAPFATTNQGEARNSSYTDQWPRSFSPQKERQQRPAIFRFFSHSSPTHDSRTIKMQEDSLPLLRARSPRKENRSSLCKDARIASKPEESSFTRDLHQDVSDVFLTIRKSTTGNECVAVAPPARGWRKPSSKMVLTPNICVPGAESLDVLASDSLLGSVLSIPSPRPSCTSSSNATRSRIKPKRPQMLLPEDVFRPELLKKNDRIHSQNQPLTKELCTPSRTPSKAPSTDETEGSDPPELPSSHTHTHRPVQQLHALHRTPQGEADEERDMFQYSGMVSPQPFNATDNFVFNAKHLENRGNLPSSTFFPMFHPVPSVIGVRNARRGPIPGLVMLESEGNSEDGLGLGFAPLKEIDIHSNEVPYFEEGEEASYQQEQDLNQSTTASILGHRDKSMWFSFSPRDSADIVSRPSVQGTEDIKEESSEESGGSVLEYILSQYSKQIREDDATEIDEPNNGDDKITTIEIAPGKRVPFQGGKETFRFHLACDKSNNTSLMIQCYGCGHAVHSVPYATHILCPLCKHILCKQNKIRLAEPRGKQTDEAPIVALGYLMHDWQKLQSAALLNNIRSKDVCYGPAMSSNPLKSELVL